MFFLFLLISLKTSFAITCLNSNGVYITPTPTDFCVECQLEGIIDVNGNCIYTTDRTTVPAIITTNCTKADDNTPYCWSSKLQRCIPSRFGAICSECHDSGQLQLTSDYSRYVCVCYLHSLDARLGCTVNPLSPKLYDTTMIQTRSTKVSCTSFHDQTYGCYAAVDSTLHQYGTNNPPVPNQCCSDILGPPPGELTETLFQNVLNYEECNTYGSIDPNAVGTNFTSFRTCSGHGTWDPVNRNCTCWDGWTLGLIGQYEGNDVYSCVACLPLWGPDSYDATQLPPYCSKIWTPDPITGIDRECSGRGYFRNGNCACYGNSTIGYWAITNLTFNGVTVQTCASCEPGYTFPSCL